MSSCSGQGSTAREDGNADKPAACTTRSSIETTLHNVQRIHLTHTATLPRTCVNSGCRSAPRSPSRKPRPNCMGIGPGDASLRAGANAHAVICGRRASPAPNLCFQRTYSNCPPRPFINPSHPDLVVAVEARHHQHLLEQLRRLRQRVPVARLQPAAHKKAGAKANGQEKSKRRYNGSRRSAAAPAPLQPARRLVIQERGSSVWSSHRILHSKVLQGGPTYSWDKKAAYREGTR